MRSSPLHWSTIALGSVVPVLPLLALELVNRRQLPESFPLFLFLFLWVLGAVFLFVLAQGVRMVLDQLPCFLGVPNCD